MKNYFLVALEDRDLDLALAVSEEVNYRNCLQLDRRAYMIRKHAVRDFAKRFRRMVEAALVFSELDGEVVACFVNYTRSLKRVYAIVTLNDGSAPIRLADEVEGLMGIPSEVVVRSMAVATVG